MSRVLLIEDDGLLTRDLRKKLEEEYHYDVTTAYSYSSAIALWGKYEGKFDCIILDLNINPHGLDMGRSDNYNQISGILVLEDICKEKTDEEKKQIWNKTIIYSAYIDQLNARKEEFTYYYCLTLIPKTAINIFRLFDKITVIINK